MNNLNTHGKRWLDIYLRYYAEGIFSFEEIKPYLNSCFRVRFDPNNIIWYR